MTAAVAKRPGRSIARIDDSDESDEATLDQSSDSSGESELDKPLLARRRGSSHVAAKKPQQRSDSANDSEGNEGQGEGDGEDNDDDDDDDDFDTPLAKKRKKAAPKAKVAKPKKPPTAKKKAPSKKAPRAPRAGKKEENLLIGESESKDVKVKFEMPGQRKVTPPQNEPLRLFYESMYHESVAKGKRSILAEDWMLSHGLLERDVAVEATARLKQAKQEKANTYATQATA